MRELKFRVWTPVRKQLLYSDRNKNSMYCVDSHGETAYVHDGLTTYNCKIALTLNGEVWIAGVYHEGAIVTQFTGLKDKNGVDIFEGDVVYDNGNTNPWTYAPTNCNIIWEESAYYVESKAFKWRLTREFCAAKLTIIGNIFENKYVLNPT